MKEVELTIYMHPTSSSSSSSYFIYSWLVRFLMF